MTLCGLPLSSLSSSVLFGCFFTFLVFFGFVACESAVCEPGSVEGVVSARASEDSATDTASAAIRESMKFEGIGLLLENSELASTRVQPLRHEPGPYGGHARTARPGDQRSGTFAENRSPPPGKSGHLP